jgi:flagellar basal-body rod protein FlgC
MSMFRIFDISGSAVSAQTQRLNVVASNLANADTVAGPDGKAYKARQVLFKTTFMGARSGMEGLGASGLPGVSAPGDAGSAGVTVSNVIEDNTPGRRVHDPKHPNADADGMVTYSNVNPIEEMVNMISASRSYQNNIEVMSTAKSLLQRTLQLGQS